MEYAVKTQFGTSEATYSGTQNEPLFGTGQGSGASPAAWLSHWSVLHDEPTRDKVTTDRVQFKSPDSPMTHTRLIDAFVDDTSLSFTDNGTMEFQELAERLTAIASAWHRLLHYSGGSLNLKKRTYHITTWEWQNGLENRNNVTITQDQANTAVSIRSLSTNTGRTYRSHQSYSQPQ
jgi:hypothetical protein